MAVVYISPVGGVAAQFFDNSGNVLTGGKLYTYQAGTTTPQASYTTSAGNVARTNPVVLNAAGRVPDSGEIWITSQAYKFVLETSTGVLIATYDNVIAAGSGTYTVQNFTGDGTTVAFTLTNAPASENSTNVYINGVYQQKNTYSLAGAVLTFSQAPPVTSLIEVNYV
tara:strand:+ start:121 stop:624 length:504 start_codon:yes stop_codon:yes gene_type:complete